MASRPKRLQKQQGQQLKIVEVKLIPTPGLEKRLTRIYDLLLREESRPNPKDQSIASQDDALNTGQK